MTSQWARWRLISPASPLFTQWFIQAQIKKTSKLCVSGLCARNSPGTPRTNCQLRGKCFHLMTSSYRPGIALGHPMYFILCVKGKDAGMFVCDVTQQKSYKRNITDQIMCSWHFYDLQRYVILFILGGETTLVLCRPRRRQNMNGIRF